MGVAVHPLDGPAHEQLVDGQAQPTAVFAPSPRPRLAASSFFALVVSFIFIFGGFYLMSLAFSFEDIGIWLFAGGMLADTIGFWIAFGWLPNRER